MTKMCNGKFSQQCEEVTRGHVLQSVILQATWESVCLVCPQLAITSWDSLPTLMALYLHTIKTPHGLSWDQEQRKCRLHAEKGEDFASELVEMDCSYTSSFLQKTWIWHLWEDRAYSVCMWYRGAFIQFICMMGARQSTVCVCWLERLGTLRLLS